VQLPFPCAPQTPVILLMLFPSGKPFRPVISNEVLGDDTKMTLGILSGSTGDDRHYCPILKFGKCPLNSLRHADFSGIGGDGGEGPVKIKGEQGCGIDEIVQGRKAGIAEQIGHGRMPCHNGRPILMASFSRCRMRAASISILPAQR